MVGWLVVCLVGWLLPDNNGNLVDDHYYHVMESSSGINYYVYYFLDKT